MNYEFIVILPIVPTSLFAETLVLSDPVQAIRASKQWVANVGSLQTASQA